MRTFSLKTPFCLRNKETDNKFIIIIVHNYNIRIINIKTKKKKKRERKKEREREKKKKNPPILKPVSNPHTPSVFSVSSNLHMIYSLHHADFTHT